MKTTIYDTDLNDFARKFLVTNPALPTPSSGEFIASTNNIGAALFESFLLFDAVAFKVYGENIPMAILINHFGVKGIEELIEQDALQFGSLNSAAHSDPEESIKLGFGWMARQPKQSDKKNLIRKIRDKYALPDQNLSSNAVSLSRSAFENGKLKSYDLSPDNCAFRELDKNGRKKLCHCAEDILQYSHLLNNNMASYSNFEFYRLFNESNKRIHEAAKIQSDFDDLTRLEDIPDLRKLFPKISSPFKQIVKLRNKSSSKKFRTWLAECSDTEDNTEISKEYVDAISNARGFFQSKTGRFTKSIAVSTVGAGLGMLVAGPAGAAGGAGVAKLLEPAADLGLDLLDEFMLSGLTKGWTPKMFFDDISRLKQTKESIQPTAETSID